MLWENLPTESATVTAYWAAYPESLDRSDESVMGSWSRAEMLAAAQIDLLRILAWQIANRGVRNPSPMPEPLPRPGVVVKRAASLAPMEPWQVQYLNDMLDAAGVAHD